MVTYVFKRPAALLAAVAPLSAVPAALTVARPSAPQVHQVEAHVELLTASAPKGIEGTDGFMGKGTDGATKRPENRGVPPRGRPV
ncbi:hypothetical protein [Micromonospora sp. SH-82]|uniref:hypothetical protein n=1 Tax=Micromonospora sp. SH-82 TaxID=3132938 RepID=UPI003EBD44A4